MLDETKKSFEKAGKIYSDGKRSLEELLREKAYTDVKESLEEKGININDVGDEDIETLVAAKTKDMISNLKGFGWGSAFALALSAFIGV
jgi:hypothetical protein